MFEINNYNYNDDWTNTNPDIPKFDYNSFYRAIVESIDDPDHIGRIKVRIPSLHGDSDVSTLPYAYPAIFAGLGNQVGQFILPPVGSIVFVTFEYSNEHRPIYFGGIPTKLGDSDQEQYYGPRINKGQPKLVTSDDIPDEYTGSEYIIYKSPSGSIIYIDDNDYNPQIVVRDSIGQEMRFTSNDLRSEDAGGEIILRHDKDNYIKIGQDDITLCADGTEYHPPFGGSGGDKNFVHNQTTASETWVIDHDLGKYPSVSVTDSAGTTVIGDVKYNSLSRITITFKSGFKGKAILN